MSFNKIIFAIQIYAHNIQGLTIEKFSGLLQDAFSKGYDFVCLSETWLRSIEIPQHEVQEYSYINKPRSLINKRAKRGSGGILLYINDKIGQNVELIISIRSEDRIWIKYRDSSSMIYTSAFVTSLQRTQQQ